MLLPSHEEMFINFDMYALFIEIKLLVLRSKESL